MFGMDHMQGYKYLFHAVAFNHVTMEWMIVACVWLGFLEQCQVAD